jgi:hypothetical protein
MMKKTFYILGLAVFGLMACNKPQDQNVADFGDEIVFTMGISQPKTRATGVSEVTTANLTQFNVIASTGTASQTAVWTDGVFTGTPNGNYTGGKLWPSETVSYNFFASNAQMTFASSGATIGVSDSNYDIVAEYIEGAAYKTSNALTFEHILAQLGTVTMKAPEGYEVTNLKVSLKPIYGGTYSIKSVNGATNDLKRAGWTRGQESAQPVYVVGNAQNGVSVPAYPQTYVSGDNDLWLVPGEYELTASYTIAKGDWHNDYVKHAGVVLLQGVNNNLGLPDTNGDNNFDDPNIPDPSDDVTDIIFTVSVTAWSNEDIPANFN